MANRKRNALSVAIDGYCARKNAERMFVRRKRTFKKVNLGGTAVYVYRPEAQIFSALRAIFYKNEAPMYELKTQKPTKIVGKESLL